MKTKKEIEELKQSWLRDACWDIETTEGFEDHYAELLEFSIAQKKKWDEANRKRAIEATEKIGCPGNFKLANAFETVFMHIELLERKIEILERIISDHSKQIKNHDH